MGSPEQPAEVLVVTVWTDAGGLRRMVSHTESGAGRGAAESGLRRRVLPTDAAVLDLVRDWLAGLGAAGEAGTAGTVRRLRVVDRTRAVNPARRHRQR
jgi:hypothetical protein